MILQMHLRSHPVAPDLSCSLSKASLSSVYCWKCMWTAKAVARLRGCTGHLKRVCGKVFNVLASSDFYIWATTWQNQQNECAPSEDSDRAPAAQRQMRQMRKKISFGPTFFHLAQTFGAYFFRRHFYFFLCYKRYELRKRLMTPNKQCRWRVFLNWWWPLVIIGYKVRPIIDTYLVDWTWCLFN